MRSYERRQRLTHNLMKGWFSFWRFLIFGYAAKILVKRLFSSLVC